MGTQDHRSLLPFFGRLQPIVGPLPAMVTKLRPGIKKERFRTQNAAGVNHIFSDVKHLLNSRVQNPLKCKPNVKQCYISKSRQNFLPTS